MTTRQQIIALVTTEARRLRDSGQMYQPIGNNTVYHILKKAGIQQPQNRIEWAEWMRGMKLNRVWLRLHHDGCMIAGYTHIKRRQKGAFEA